jgi:glycine betaine/proline transport system ATP-binding protein
MKTIMEIQHVSKLYGVEKEKAAKLLEAGVDKETVRKKTGVTAALWDINLSIPEGKVFVIIGLSGSGKSTLVRMCNRLNEPTSGKILFEGNDIGKLDTAGLRNFRRNKVSMVFQSFGLMSNRDVLGNVAYGLEVKGVDKENREKKAMKIIDMVGLSGWEHQDCSSLSGGMRQRVGIARALAPDSPVLLMDEPFSALDPLVRQDMQFELLRIQHKLRKTVIFITHDMDEAFKLGDRIAIMKDGRLIQVASPEEMSLHPADDYVRAFISNADKTKVLAVSSIMITPKVLVRTTDSVRHSIRVMTQNALSSAYVVDEDLHLVGIIGIKEAIEGEKQGKELVDVLDKDVHTVRQSDLIASVMPLAAESKYPLAVLDDEGVLAGIVTKASVLSALM